MNPTDLAKPITGIWTWLARSVDVRLENTRLKRKLADAEEALLASEAKVRERDAKIERLNIEFDAARIAPGSGLDMLRKLPSNKVV